MCKDHILPAKTIMSATEVPYLTESPVIRPAMGRKPLFSGRLSSTSGVTPRNKEPSQPPVSFWLMSPQS